MDRVDSKARLDRQVRKVRQEDVVGAVIQASEEQTACLG